MSVSGHDLTRNMSFEIVGREEDRATVEAFVGRAEGGASALVLEGEAGIGKSTLWLAGVAGRALAWAARPSVATGGGRARSRSRGAGRPVRGCPRGRRPSDLARRGDVRSRSRSYVRRRQTIRSITARSAWRYATCCTCSASGSRFCLRSTTFSGSTRPRRARSRLRCEDSTRARFSCCSPGGLSLAPSRPGWSKRWRRGASSGCRLDRSASARSIGSCTTASAGLRPPDAAPHPRAVGRQSVLRAGAGARSRRGRRPARAASGSGDAGRARPREARRTSRGDTRRARARLGAGDAVGVAPGAGRRRRRRARAGSTPRM